MKAWLVYKITHHGEPVYPVFITKHQNQVKWFLEYCDSHRFDSKENYFVRYTDIDMPKLGVTPNRKREGGRITWEKDCVIIKEIK